MTRYDLVDVQSIVERNSRGDYVEYEEANGEIERLREELSTAEDKILSLQDEFETLKAELANWENHQ